MGYVSASSETAFNRPVHEVYAFVSDPRNWEKTFPGSKSNVGISELPLKVGFEWEEHGDLSDGSQIVMKWSLASNVKDKQFIFKLVSSTPDLPFITIAYEFFEPGAGVSLFRRTVTGEVAKGVSIPDNFLLTFQPSEIDKYHEAVERELALAAKQPA